jgi:hypothetical protein
MGMGALIPALLKEKQMGLLNQVFQGNPNVLGNLAAGGSAQAPNVAIDTVDGALFMSVGNGWQPLSGVAQKAVASAQVANNANVLTFTAPVAGLYMVDLYEVSTNTPTAATLPAMTVVYTDLDSSVAVTDTLASVGSVSAAGVVNQGRFLVNVAAGGTIVVATTSYAAGSGTALAYTAKARVSYRG